MVGRHLWVCLGGLLRSIHLTLQAPLYTDGNWHLNSMLRGTLLDRHFVGGGFSRSAEFPEACWLSVCQPALGPGRRTPASFQ